MFENIWIERTSRLYGWIIKIGSNLQSFLLLLFRLTWGLGFYHAGMGKFAHMDQTVSFFQAVGLPFPSFHAHFVAAVETVGGLCLVFGFASRLISLPLIITMFSAYGLAHAHVFKDFAFVRDPSLLVREAPFPFLMTTLLVFAFGPGRLSVDAWLKRASANWKKL